MLKTEQYVSRPCKTFDAPALWDWLRRKHPEVMTQFATAFAKEVDEYYWGVPSQYPKLREHIEGFLK